MATTVPPAQPNPSNPSKHGIADYTTLAYVVQLPLEWQWKGYLVAGKLNGLVGDPDKGKSLLTLDIAARITRGWPMPLNAGDARQHAQRQVTTKPRDVILLCAEDDAADTIAPRLAVAGADLARVHQVTHYRDASGIRRFINLADTEARAALLRLVETQEVRLVIADPMASFFGKSDAVDMNREQDVRSVLTEFAEALAKTDCVFLAIRHQGKDAGRDPMYRALGSIGFTAVFRNEWAVGVDPEDETTRVFYRLKGNLSVPMPSLAFHIEDTGGVNPDNPQPFIVWDGESRWDARTLAHAMPADSPRGYLQGIFAAATTPLTLEQLRQRLSATDYEGSTEYRAVQNVVNNMVQGGSVVRTGRGLFARRDAPFAQPQPQSQAHAQGHAA